MESEGLESVRGLLQIIPKGSGFLRSAELGFQPGRSDVWVSNQWIRQYGLIDGAEIQGMARLGDRGWQLVSIDALCGQTPDTFKNRKAFDQLTAINPQDRICLGREGNKTMRIIDLVAPIGKGTRGMIVAPPKTGKTTILEEMANAIHASQPDTRLIVLLIDERPEEVTHFKRNVQAEVFASSSDQSLESHVVLAEMVMAHVRCELECGRDVVVLIDSITRLSRAFNATQSSSRRTLSGGLDARALEIPRRFFGLARNIENGGSVTVIATAMVNTGSRMDDYIFEEFKGTGNSEIVLDRSLADARIFPAIDIKVSGSRREELLFAEDEMVWIRHLRRKLSDLNKKDAMQLVIDQVERTESNRELFAMGVKE